VSGFVILADESTSIADRDSLDSGSIDRLFWNARSQNGWLDIPVPDDLLERVYETAKMGPSSMNSNPLRLVLIRTKEGKEMLRPALAPGNVEKTMSAPVTAIVAYDLRFYDHLPRLFPHRDLQPVFVGNEAHALRTAFRNGTLQGAYVMFAARAHGLDVGPMSGFDNEKVDAAFFAGTTFRSNFLLNLGYGDPTKLFPRNPRLSFEEIATLR
jgi:3-hydroxypropanoate dehydrogenase